MTLRRVCRLIVAPTAVAAVSTWLPSCGSTSRTFGPSQLTRLTISGPSTVVPGSVTQFSAVATYSDGSTKDVTGSVVWRSSNVSVLTIGGTGLGTALKSGSSMITAALSTGRATQTVSVVPAGTFTLSGTVRSLGNPLAGTSVQVTGGTGTGLTAVTGADGSYQLFGVAGEIQLAVSKSSYVSITQVATVNDNTVLNFDLRPVNSPTNLEGTYTLHITADPECATAGGGALPAIGRQREYQTTIQQSGSQLRAGLSGATFLPSSNNSLDGQVTPDGATFCCVNWMGYYYSGRRDVAELLPADQVYLPSGAIEVTRSGEDLAGTFNGTITIRGNGSLDGPVIGQCASTHHTVTFTSLGANSARISARR